MTATRRALLGAGLGSGLGLLAAPRLVRAAGPVDATDLLGRPVALKQPARRVVLGSARHLAVLNLLAPDPASLVVGWNDDLRRAQAGEYAAYARRFPALDQVPVIARGQDPMAAEAVISLRPDLVLLTRSNAAGGGTEGRGPAGGGTLLRTLEEAGIPAAVVDFFAHPLADTQPSIAILGRLLGRPAQAQALLGFYGDHLNRLRALSVPDADRPVVFLHAHAGGVDCCASPGRGTFDDFIRLAGGRNLGAETLAGVNGSLSLEYVLTRNPDIYVATGGPFGGRGGVSLGAGVPPALARESLAQMIAAQNLGSLAAVRQGRAHALWHGFNDSPAHLLAIEVMARCCQPERARAIDPAATLAELNERFAAVPMQGTYWIDLPA